MGTFTPGTTIRHFPAETLAERKEKCLKMKTEKVTEKPGEKMLNNFHYAPEQKS